MVKGISMTDRTDRLKDRCIVVTGGASGIGEACARRLAEDGARVVIADINTKAALEVATELSGLSVEIDVASEPSIKAAAERIEQEVGHVDGLVTSAGILQGSRSPHEFDVDDYDRVVNVDQRGTYLTCRAFGTRMATRGRGAIVTIASIAGMRSTPLHAYSPAKAAVISITECLSAEWGRSGVRVNAVSPGYTLTPALERALASRGGDASNMSDNTAMGRMVKPDEVANAVAFLISDEASAITGANLPVDAGWLVAPPWHTYGGIRPAY
jgi:NAD(P)-dependent dehydrogenase (short-subunit alcohol dehydrogenase family)